MSDHQDMVEAFGEDYMEQIYAGAAECESNCKRICSKSRIRNSEGTIVKLSEISDSELVFVVDSMESLRCDEEHCDSAKIKVNREARKRGILYDLSNVDDDLVRAIELRFAERILVSHSFSINKCEWSGFGVAGKSADSLRNYIDESVISRPYAWVGVSGDEVNPEPESN